LINDRALYSSLTEASNNLSSLLSDLESHPGRYVHFSLFGRSEEKLKAKAEKKAVKAAAKVERDSLRRVQ
ncbi:MAG: MCE family protein, partial [Alistipes sp.]